MSRLVVPAVLALALLACSGSSDGASPAASASTASTAGVGSIPANLGSGDQVADPTQTSLSGVGGNESSSATVTAPSTTYVVPSIPASATAEICAGTKLVTQADDAVGALLGPVLSADASANADAALIAALAKVKPLIEQAQSGYDRMAAVLPADLANDAATVRDATLTFYGALSASQTMDVLVATVTQAQAFTDAAKEAAARLDATTRKTCNQSIYNS